MPRASRSIFTCICSAIVCASSSTALAGADSFFTTHNGGDPGIYRGPAAEGNCLSCDADGICDLQVGLQNFAPQSCMDGQWRSLGFPFDTGGSVVDSVTSVHLTNTGSGDLYIMGGTCGGPDVNNILAVVCDAIMGAPSGVPITTNFTPVATSAVDPTWVVMVFRSSFSFDVMYNMATAGTTGSAFGNLTGLPGPAEWGDLDAFGFGACYCVTLEGGPPEPGACCLEDESCMDGLLPDECAGLGGVFQGNNSNCAVVDCGPATGACCLAEGDVCQDGTTQADCDAAGGTYQGDNTDCANIDCAFPDDCVDATPVDVPSLTIGTTIGATFDDAGFCGTSNTAPGVWYTVVGTGTTMTASFCQNGGTADYDSKLSVYTGDCDMLLCVDGNDDSCGLQSEVSWFGELGTTYRILVHGFGGGQGNFELALFEAAGPPANDLCEDAEAVDVGPGGSANVEGSTNDATFDDVGFCGTSNTAPGIWYSVIGNGNTMTASTCDQADYDTRISVFCGDCDFLLCVDGNDDGPGCGGFTSELNWCAQDGAEYLILVHGFGSATGDFTMTISDDGASCEPTVDCGAGPAANDLCEDAEAVDVGPGGSVNVEGSTDLASFDDVGFCGTSNTAPGVWYSVIGNGNTMTASTCDQAEYDTKISVFCSSCDDLLCVDGNDDGPGCGGFTSELSWCAQDGAEYLILVHGFGSATGSFTMTISDDGASCKPTVVCVEDDNAPPDCSGAFASDDELWPPNHMFHDISILGVTDPDGDPVTITITGIFQDESVNGTGDGNTCPDGTGVGSDTASVRAERSGFLDGRVYHISFLAEDGLGGACEGTVTVCVPHDMGQGRECVDQGPTDDSTDCDGAASGGGPRAGTAGRRPASN